MGRTSTDAETRAAGDDHAAIRLWLRMLATSRLIETRTRRLLQERYGTTLPRFDLMAQLERVPAGLKMNELSKRMMVTGGNVTGITDGLALEGLVERVDDPDDRRAWLVRLTPAGRRAFARMARDQGSLHPGAEPNTISTKSPLSRFSSRMLCSDGSPGSDQSTDKYSFKNPHRNRTWR